ncbi:MAG: SMC-Scp complex subunit ScpB [archaeon]
MDLSDESVEELDNDSEQETFRKVEAALFIAGKFMSIQELVALTDVNPILLKKTLEDLKDKHRNSGIEIVNKNNLWKMDVSSDYTWMVNKLATGSSEFSKAEQETLAIIAYKHPMKQSVLVKIRGNKAYDHVKKFVEMGLINKKRIGHTSELTLSDSFHEYFHVSGEGDAASDANLKSVGLMESSDSLAEEVDKMAEAEVMENAEKIVEKVEEGKEKESSGVK